MKSALQRIQKHHIPIHTIIDLGASNGQWSRLAIQFFPRAFFLAVEPLKERASALQSLKTQHARFDYSSCIAGDIDGKSVPLNVSNDLDGSTVNGNGGESRILVQRTIDSLVDEKKLQGSYLLKFDTHGYEIPILKGAQKTLKSTRVIIMEVYNFTLTTHSLRFHEMCAYLETVGFRCYDMAEPMFRLHDHALWQMDLFFCRKDEPLFAYERYQ